MRSKGFDLKRSLLQWLGAKGIDKELLYYLSEAIGVSQIAYTSRGYVEQSS